jgi:uncharacterized RDD family membrane protein YckC
MKLASLGSRLLGQIIDSVLAFVPIVFVVVVIGTTGAESDFAISLLPFAVLFGVGYYLFADAMPGGQSFGKLLLGIAVVDEATRRPCSMVQSFIRNILAPILGFLDWIFIVGSRRQRLGDMIARTIVVEKGVYLHRERMYAEFDRL